ncbi:MAG TPA: asparagine synthase-related protein [Burkholderiaceae bacterium]|nr:asparagine synthase-related protein [Burkholderiaceae bacterium]
MSLSKGTTGLFGSFGAPLADEGARLMLGAAAASALGPITRGDASIGACGTAPAPTLLERDRLVLAYIGHPRIRTARGWSADPAGIADAIERTGPAALATIHGDFALAAWNPLEARGLLALDRIGVRQLVYGVTRGGLAFASTLDMLLRHPGVGRELSPQAVFDYLYFHVCPGPQTIYRDLLRLSPGHYLEFGPGIEPKPRAYWSMRFDEAPPSDLRALKLDFVERVRTAVAAAADGAACGAFLSGGTDSSTVSGMLGRVTGERAKVFSIGFDAAGYDEMNYARIAARHFDCEHHEYYVTPADVVAAAPRIAAHYDQPFGNASAIPAYYCALLAREHGVQRLLAGDGGDELFGGNERYAKQHVLALYHRLPAALRSSLIEPLVLSTPFFRALPGVRKLHSYVQQAATPMPQRYEGHNLITHLTPENVLAPEFLASIDRDHPHELMRAAHAPYADCSLINQMLGIDLRFTLTDNDLPKVTRTCELAGADVAFPLLDESVVEFSARLPAELKLRGTRLRWFFKEALRDFLPPEIITKRKHGFGLPVGVWLSTHPPLLDLANAAIDTLRPLGILRPGFVDDLRQRLLPAHPAYYGTMMWVLMMLGLWFDANRSGSAPDR